MKLVFMGTPDFAVPCLQALLDAGHEICGVYTQPDKPVGRKQILTPPPVKALALQHNLPVYQPTSFKDESVLQELTAMAPQAIIVVAYGRILPKAVLDLPQYGCINVHASLLPKYRGAAPIQWAVLNGDAITGVTTMYMAEGLDTGDMLQTIETKIGENETSGELFDRLAALGAELIVQTVAALPAGLERHAQDEALATHTSKITKALSPMDFTKSAAQLHNQVRGLSPWPTAQTGFRGKVLKIHKSLPSDQKGGAPGTIFEKNGQYFVACGQGALQLVEVQYEGSRRMAAADFFRGHPITAGEQFEVQV